MARIDLELEEGEEVLFRTRRGWRSYLWLPYAVFLTYMGAILANLASGGVLEDNISPFKLLVLVTVAPLIATLRIVSIEAAVTNRRVLWKEGWFRPWVGQIDHSEIAGCVIWWSSWPSRFILRRRSGGRSVLLFAFDFQGLEAAIAQATGLPRSAKATPRLELAAIIMQTMTLWIAAVILGATFYAMIQIAALGPYPWPLLVLLILGLSFLGFIIAFMSLLAGRLIAFLCLRPLLTVGEVRLYLDTLISWCDRRKKAKGLCHLYLTLVRQVLSLLYGEDLRLPAPAVPDSPASDSLDLRQ